MADENQVVELQQTTVVDPFGNNSWSNDQPAVENNATPVTEPANPAPVNAAQPVVEQEEILEPKEWLKREFDVEDVTILKQEREELKTLREKAQTPAEIKFANEQSRLLHEAILAGKEDEVYNILDKKRKLSAADKLSASDLLKLQIQQTNGHYTSQDVEDVFEEKYSVPKKPVQQADELDEEYTTRVNEWQKEADRVTRRIERDSFTAKEALAKMNAELVLPQLAKQEPVANPEAQLVEQKRLEELRNKYTKALESDFKNFNGYEIKYKDEEVEIPANFVITDEDKVALKTELENFDVDGFIMSRWFDGEGNPKVVQMMEDVTLLRKKEAVFQKFVNEIGTKMREHYIKLKTQTNINTTGETTFQPRQPGAAVSPFSQGAWSEAPPTFN